MRNDEHDEVGAWVVSCANEFGKITYETPHEGDIHDAITLVVAVLKAAGFCNEVIRRGFEEADVA